MKKVLILGIDGLLGYNIYNKFMKSSFLVKGTIKGNKEELSKYSFFKLDNIFDNIDFLGEGFKKIKQIINEFIPEIIINCICLKNSSNSNIFLINTYLPIFLDSFDKYVITISSDITKIFPHDKIDDNYLLSKWLLEKTQLNNTLIIKTSFYGHELFNLKESLVNWFLFNTEDIYGYENYIFNGLYVGNFVKELFMLTSKKKKGIINIFNKKSISKFDLLKKINKHYSLNKDIRKKTLEDEVDLTQKSDIDIDIEYSNQIKLMYNDYITLHFNSINKCRHCNSENLINVIDLGLLPLAGGFLKKSEFKKNKLYPLNLFFCENCKVLQIRESFNPDYFFKDYRYLSSVSYTLSNHFIEYANDLKEMYPDAKNALEIGCNDGVLLKPLKELGFDVVGVDPANNITEVAVNKGLKIINNYFSLDLAYKIKKEYPYGFDIITGNNVLAHIEQIESIFQGFKYLLAKNGVLVFEVQYLGDLINYFQYDFIYHEHIFYYSITALNNILKLHKLKIINIEKNDIHGGTIRIHSTHIQSNKYEEYSELIELLKEEEKNKIVNYIGIKNFYKKILKHKESIFNEIQKIKKVNKDIKIVCYGASGRSVTFINFCGLNKNYIEYFIDESSERINRFIPGVLIPIYSPEKLKEEKPDIIIITAWTYSKEIIKKLEWFINDGGEIIIPFPEVKYYKK